MRNALLSLFALFVCSSVLAAGHEITTPVIGASPLAAFNPSVATNGETFAAVWTNGAWIYGALADSSGRRITPADVPIMPVSPTYGAGVTAAITAIGHDYFLFWSDPSGSYLSTLGADLHVVDTIALNGVPPLTSVSVASSADQILVAGGTGNNFPPAQTMAYLLNRDGALARAPIQLGSLPAVRASWSGRDFLIAHAALTGVVLHRVSTTSTSDVQITSRTDGVVYNPAAATSGDATVVVWLQGTKFWSAAVTSDGTVSKHQIAAPPVNVIPSADIVATGDTFVATFGNLVYRLDRSGAVIAGPLDVGQRIVQIAATASAIYGVSSGPSALSNAIAMAVRIPPDLHNASSDFLSMTPAEQEDPSIASDGFDFMAVFREQTGATMAIRGAPIQRGSTAASGQPITFTNAATNTPPAIAHGNNVYVATWSQPNGVFASRISNQGVVLDSQPIQISSDIYAARPDIAWNGRAFLEVWAGTGGIRAATIREDGSVSSATVVAADGSLEPRIAWNGKVFLVVYGIAGNCVFDPCFPFRIQTKAVRVSADGTALDSTPAVLDAPPPPNPPAIRATVASNGSDFVVALDTTSGTDVVRIDTDGSSMVIGPRRTVLPWFGLVTNDVRWSGDDYLLASTYSDVAKQWLSITHLSSMNRVVSESSAAAPTIPSLATNVLGESAVVIAEATGNPAVPRAHVYFDSDFSQPPPPPAAPTNVTAVGSPKHFTMTWSVGADADAVVVDVTRGENAYSFALAATTRSYTFNDPSITSVVLRSVNAGGMSNAVGALLEPPVRRRATR